MGRRSIWTVTDRPTTGCSTSTATGLADRALGGQVAYVDTDGDGRWDIKLTDSNDDGRADVANDL